MVSVVSPVESFPASAAQMCRFAAFPLNDLNHLNVSVIMWSFGLLLGLNQHGEGVTLGSGSL